VKGSSDGKFV